MPDPAEIVAALLRQRTPVSFNVLGPSMNPTIRDGESVTVRPLEPGPVPRGSIMSYTICGRMAVHRCIFYDKRTNRVFTVGDAAVQGGDWIPSADVLGVAKSVQRGGTIHRLDTRRARWAGLLRFYLRPLRRIAVAVYRRLKIEY